MRGSRGESGGGLVAARGDVGWGLGGGIACQRGHRLQFLGHGPPRSLRSLGDDTPEESTPKAWSWWRRTSPRWLGTSRGGERWRLWEGQARGHRRARRAAPRLGAGAPAATRRPLAGVVGGGYDVDEGGDRGFPEGSKVHDSL